MILRIHVKCRFQQYYVDKDKQVRKYMVRYMWKRINAELRCTYAHNLYMFEHFEFKVSKSKSFLQWNMLCDFILFLWVLGPVAKISVEMHRFDFFFKTAQFTPVFSAAYLNAKRRKDPLLTGAIFSFSRIFINTFIVVNLNIITYAM